MGLSYIPLTEIVCYATVISYERVTDFIAVIRALDDVFVRHQNDKAEDGRSQVAAND